MWICKSFTLIVFLCYSHFVTCQVQTNEVPISFNSNLIHSKIGNKNSTVKALQLTDMNNNSLNEEASNIESNCPTCRKFYYGKNKLININLIEESTKFELNNGNIYVLKLQSKTAKGLQVEFNNYSLLKGEKIFIYSDDYKQIFGAFTSKNNKPNKKLLTRIVKGQNMVIEYYSPYSKSNLKSRNLKIGQFTHIFRDIGKTQFSRSDGFGDSGDCSINVNCEYHDEEKKAIALVTYNDPDYSMSAICSGALINSAVSSDRKKPLFMTAGHCSGNIGNTFDQYSNRLFYFGFEDNSCFGSIVDPISNSVTIEGAYLRSKGYYAEFVSPATDYALYELALKPEDFTNVTYLGWDRSTNFYSKIINISHPNGDAKKIATTFDQPERVSKTPTPCVTAREDDLESFIIQNWNSGVTHQGSSGSPLISDGKIIGVLSGGFSRCTNSPNESPCNFSGERSGPDFFARLDFAWNNGRPRLDGKKLKDYLDPDGINPIWIDLFDPNSSDPGNPGGGGSGGGGLVCQWNVDHKVSIDRDAAVDYIVNVPGIYPRCIDDDFIISPLPNQECSSPRWLMAVSDARYDCNSIPVEFEDSLCDRPPFSFRCKCLFVNVVLVVTEVGSDGFQNGSKNEKNFRFQIADDFGAGVVNINELPITIKQIKEVLPLKADKFYKLNIKHTNASRTKTSLGRFFRYIENEPLALSGTISESRHSNKYITLTNATINQRIKIESQDKVILKNNTVIKAGLFVSDSSPDCNDGSTSGRSSTSGLTYTYIPEAMGPRMLEPELFQEINKISIYPNPSSSGIFKIKCTNRELCEITVFDLNGKQIQHSSTTDGKLDLSGQLKGIYLLHIKTNQGSEVKKVVYR